MVIGPKQLLSLVNKIKLVENLSDRELTNPEGAGFDLRLGKVFSISGKAFLGIEERQTPKEKLIAEYGKNKKFIFHPAKYYLVSTIESVNLPQNFTAHIFCRSTLFRCGLQLLVTQVAPGYQGPLTFALFNPGNIPTEIEMGARIAHIQFLEVKGGGKLYRGQWKGGRISARKKEKQV